MESTSENMTPKTPTGVPMGGQKTEGEGRESTHIHEAITHTHDHYHVTHHHRRGIAGVGEWEHQTSWHTHEHSHLPLTHSHDYSRDEETAGFSRTKKPSSHSFWPDVSSGQSTSKEHKAATAQGSGPGSGHSALSSRITARRNAWNPTRATHRGQRSTDRVQQAGYMTAPDRRPTTSFSPCLTGAVHT